MAASGQAIRTCPKKLGLGVQVEKSQALCFPACALPLKPCGDSNSWGPRLGYLTSFNGSLSSPKAFTHTRWHLSEKSKVCSLEGSAG